MSDSTAPPSPAALPTDSGTPRAAPMRGWMRAALIVASLVELLDALSNLSILFGDISDVPGTRGGGLIILATIVLRPFAAAAALALGVTGWLRGAVAALAGVVLLNWLWALPSVFTGGLGLEGASLFPMLEVLFRIIACPLLAVAALALARRAARLDLAAALVVLPTLVSIASIIAFAVGIFVYGF